MNKRRDNLIEFIYYNIQNIRNQILPFLGLAISLIGEKNKFTPYVKIGFYLLILFIVIYSFLKWYNKIFEFSEHTIRVSEGVFSKRKNDIPYNRVKSINTSDSLLKRLFGIANFSVELIGGSKVVFVLKQREIEDIKSRLFPNLQNDTRTFRVEKLNPFEYLLLSHTNRRVFLTAISLSATLHSFAINFLDDKKETPEKNGKELFAELKSTNLFSFEFIFPMFIAFLSIFALSYIICYIFIYLTYGNFRITSNNNDIDIRYGTLNKKKYHIPKNQIRSLRINEPILYRMFGFVQVKVDCIGLNEKNSSSVLLHPIMKKTEIAQMLAIHIPAFEQQSIEHRPVKESLKIFFFQSTYKLLICTFVLSLFSLKSISLLLLFPLFLTHGFLNWKYSGLTYNDKYATVRQTKGLKVVTTTTLKRYVETTNTKQSIFMRKQNLNHYQIAVYSEKTSEIYSSNFLHTPNKVDFHNYLNINQT